MKQLLLSLFAVTSLSFGVNAQATFEPQSGASDTVSANWTSGELQVHNNLHSLSATPVTIKWRVTSYGGFSDGWVLNGFCDNFNCYNSGGVLGGSAYTSSPYGTEFGNFDARFDGTAAPMGSSAYVTASVRDNATSYQRNLTFIAHKFPTGVTQTSVSDDNVVIWPNPAPGYVNVLYNGTMPVTSVAIYNMIGKIVGVWKVGGNSAKLDIDNVPSGAYMMRLMNDEGKVIATRRFNHQ